MTSAHDTVLHAMAYAMIAAALFGQERLSPRLITGVVLIVAGVVVLLAR